MDLYLIRHAQSLNNLNPLEDRIAEPPLTELGHRQAQCLAVWLRHIPVTRILVSPFLRSLQTAEHLRKTTGLFPQVWVDLHEQGGCVSGIDLDSFRGQPGMTRAEIESAFPGYLLPAEIDGRGWWQSMPYETQERAQERAGRVARRLRQEFAHTEEVVACVSHGEFLLCLIAAFLEFPIQPKRWIAHPFNTALARLSLQPNAIQLYSYNATGHLPAELIT
ncbi:MAG: histidine phosphatase family protein [Planctomycetes bacterium]|nr:histidine phosphatase family protein [Planctomycetota bacterium]